MDDLRPTIVRLLSNMASPKEIQQYLKRFSQLDASKFARPAPVPRPAG